MPSQSNPFKMVLIFAPLIIIPLLAVFGLPQLPPIAATPETADQLPLTPLTGDLTQKAQPGVNPAMTQAAQPPTGDPFNMPGHPVQTNPASPASKWQPPAESMQGWKMVQASNDTRPAVNEEAQRDFRSFGEQGAPEFSQTDMHQPPQSHQFQQPPAPQFQPPTTSQQHVEHPATPPVEATPWQSARKRLKDLGITSFHLTPSRNGRDFTFCCLYTPHDNPRITHRFEADAPEPLQAVEKVLQQVEGWRARQ